MEKTPVGPIQSIQANNGAGFHRLGVDDRVYTVYTKTSFA
jgi:hypothetical protein